MKKIIKALILFANPKQTQKLEILREEEIIKDALDVAKYKNKLRVKFVRMATIHDLRRNLLKEKFHILQISSHGTAKGLILEDEDGEPHHVPAAPFANWLKKHDSLECLILNACHSLHQGVLVSRSIPVTIAMEDKIADKAGLEFSRGFYDAVAMGNDYEFAYEEGRDNVRMCVPSANFRAEIIKKEAVHRETDFIDGQEREIKVFANVWFTSEKFAWWSIRSVETGTLHVYAGSLKFGNSKMDLRIAGILGVRHTKMSGDINNNWIEVAYKEDDSTKSAYFADASKLGVGNLTGGDETIFELLYRQFGNLISSGESGEPGNSSGSPAVGKKWK